MSNSDDKQLVRAFGEWIQVHRNIKKEETIEELLSRYTQLRQTLFATDTDASDPLHVLKSANHLAEMSILNLDVLA